MVTLAVLSADQRLAFQINGWLKEMADSVRWEIHSDLAAFVQKIETEGTADADANSGASEEAPLDAEDIGAGKSSEVHDPFYRLMIVDLELLHSNNIQPIEWARQFKKMMDDKHRSDPLFPMKILFLAFEGGGFKVDQFRDVSIDDLVLKPLDRSVFLQKIEVMASDDPDLKPTFLFRQETDLTIEIGKDAVIEEISEFSFAMKNPSALAPGVFGSVHCALFGQEGRSRVIGRVYKTEPHPADKNQYLVRFGFFGARSDQQANIKKYVREHQPPARSRPPPTPVSDMDPALPFNRLAVIDMNADIFHEIESTMKDHYVGVKTTHFLSYARLLGGLKQFYPVAPSAAAPAQASGAAVPEPLVLNDTHDLRAWEHPGDVIIQILSTGAELLKFDTDLLPTDLIFGKSVQDLLSKPREFFAGLDKQDANELQEMVGYAVSGGKGRAFMKFIDPIGNVYFIEATAHLSKMGEGEEPSHVRVELKQVAKDLYAKHAASAAEAKPIAGDFLFDGIVIDANLIRGDLQPWFDGLHEAYMKAGIIAPGVPMPKIILLADEKSSNQPENYRNKIVSDFIFKPLDRKVVSFKIKNAIDELVPRKEPEVSPFVRADLPAKLAKDVQMEELSEYGLSIAHPTAFKKGTMMRFFSPLLGGGAEGVLAKCTHCVINEEKQFLCHFVFFGAADEILKRIRNWIREDYVQRKEAPP